METAIIDKIRGSLVGGAVGDALGYPVEFIHSYEDIQKRYGENGITRLDKSHWWIKENDKRAELKNKAWISETVPMRMLSR